MLSTESLNAAVNALTYPKIETHIDREHYKENVAAYRVEVKRLEGEWAAWLADEYAPDGLTEGQTKKIFEKAWEDGHAYGYSEVENYYNSLSEFLTRFLEA